MSDDRILTYDKLLSTAEARLSRLLMHVATLGQLERTQFIRSKLEHARIRIRATEQHIEELTILRHSALQNLENAPSGAVERFELALG